MKTLKLFITALFAVALSLNLSAQSPVQKNTTTVKTETFKVWGNCGMCKTRIEKAVKEEGASNADWNVKTKMLTVTFDPSKNSVESFSKSLALVGHDTDKFKAEDKVYNALPGCCKYERAK